MIEQKRQLEVSYGLLDALIADTDFPRGFYEDLSKYQRNIYEKCLEQRGVNERISEARSIIRPYLRYPLIKEIPGTGLFGRDFKHFPKERLPEEFSESEMGVIMAPGHAFSIDSQLGSVKADYGHLNISITFYDGRTRKMENLLAATEREKALATAELLIAVGEQIDLTLASSSTP